MNHAVILYDGRNVKGKMLETLIFRNALCTRSWKGECDYRCITGRLGEILSNYARTRMGDNWRKNATSFFLPDCSRLFQHPAAKRIFKEHFDKWRDSWLSSIKFLNSNLVTKKDSHKNTAIPYATLCPLKVRRADDGCSLISAICLKSMHPSD